jgi:hypothetical protein
MVSLPSLSAYRSHRRFRCSGYGYGDSALNLPVMLSEARSIECAVTVIHRSPRQRDRHFCGMRVRVVRLGGRIRWPSRRRQSQQNERGRQLRWPQEAVGAKNFCLPGPFGARRWSRLRIGHMVEADAKGDSSVRYSGWPKDTAGWSNQGRSLRSARQKIELGHPQNQTSTRNHS